MGYHEYWLDLFDSFERLQTELEARESLMVLSRDIQPKWEVQAFLGTDLQWADPAYDEEELQRMKKRLLKLASPTPWRRWTDGPCHAGRDSFGRMAPRPFKKAG